MLKAEGRDSISRAGRLNPDKCARKLNCPVVLNKNKRGCRLRSNFRQDLANPFGNHVGEREGGRDGNAIAPSRRSADADGHGLRDREKRKEKRERSDLGKVLCAIHVPLLPFSLIETSLPSAKRSQLSAWMAPDKKLGPSLLRPPSSSSHIPISSDGGIPACIQGGMEEDPTGPEKGYFPQKRETDLLSQIILKRPVMHEEEKRGPMDW